MMPPTSIDGTDITGATIDGTDVQEITVDGDTVFTAVPDIPNSVIHQYPFSTFTTSTWADNVGTADMTVNGMVASTLSNGEDSISGDGTDDFGQANGPEDLPENETFGIALIFSFPSTVNLDTLLGVDEDGTFDNSRIELRDGGNPNGTIFFSISDDNDNSISLKTTSAFADGSPHALIINKLGNSASDIDFYVDNMSTAQSTNILSNNNFDHLSYSQTTDLSFFARNVGGTKDLFFSGDVGIFEFNSEPYTQAERDGFLSRRQEV